MKTIITTTKITAIFIAALFILSCNEIVPIPIIDVSGSMSDDDDGSGTVVGGDGIEDPREMPSTWKEYYVDYIENYDENSTYDITAMPSGSSIQPAASAAEAEISSTAMQSAIDYVSEQGGGILNIPAGHYRFSSITMKSNVHVVVDKDATLYIAYPDDFTSNFSNQYMFTFTASGTAHIENCSIRCSEYGEQFTVDFELPSATESADWNVRFAIMAYVKNAMIEGAKFIDNMSEHCAISVSASARDTSALQHAENVTIRNCSLICAVNGGLEEENTAGGHPGYGLIQIHSALNFWCEDLTSSGGVTLRLETGASNAQGVDIICGKNIGCVNGRCALMMSPHRQDNGAVMIDGLWSKGSTFTAEVDLEGFDDSDEEYEDGEEQIGTFKTVCLRNVYAVYGINSQIKIAGIYCYEPALVSEIRYEEICSDNIYPDVKWGVGPSCSAIVYSSSLFDELGSESFIEGIVTEGFTYNVGGYLDYDSEALLERYDNLNTIRNEWKALYGL